MPLGLATRRAIESMSSPVVAAIQAVPSTVSRAIVAAISSAEAALHAGLGQRIDEPRDIGRAGAGDRAERGELRLVGHPHREAERREEVAELARASASSASAL